AASVRSWPVVTPVSRRGSRRAPGRPCRRARRQPDKRVCRGLSGDLRHGAELLRERTEEPQLATDEGDLSFVEGGRVERHEEDRLPHRDGLVQVVQEREDG